MIDQLQNIFAQIFENPKIEINLSSTPGDIAGWNSLKHVLLINEIEKAFNIQFTLDEMIEMQTVGDIVRCIESKI